MPTLFKRRHSNRSSSFHAAPGGAHSGLQRSRFGKESFQAMLDFASLCRQYVPHVVMTVVDIIGDEKIQRCQAICDELGVKLRVRPFEE